MAYKLPADTGQAIQFAQTEIPRMEARIRIYYAELRDNPRTRQPPPQYQEFIDEVRRLRLRRRGIPREYLRQYERVLESLAVRERTWKQLVKNLKEDFTSKERKVEAREEIEEKGDASEKRVENIEKQKLLLQLYRKQNKKCTELGLQNPETFEEYLERMGPSFSPSNLEDRFVFDINTGKTYFKSST